MKNFPYLFLLVLVIASCSSMKEPIFRGIENVKVNGMGMTESAVTLDIRYMNPNGFRGKLKNAEGEAWVDSLYLGRFIVDTTVSIPANSEFLVPVKLALDMKRLMKHSLALLLQEEVLLRISGEARAGKNGFYRKFPLNYQGKQNVKELFNR